MPSVALYSADQVFVSFMGVSISGRGPDTFAKVSRNQDSFKLLKGADGEGTRTRKLDRSGTVVLTLLQTSKYNNVLQNLLLADENSNNGVSIGPIMVKDYGGNALWTSPEAWIRKPADTEAAAEAGTREWTLECDVLIGPLPAHA